MSKPEHKTVRVPINRGPSPVSPTYTNGRGTNVSLLLLAGMIHRAFDGVFGEFMCEEDADGNLLIRTGMRRVGVQGVSDVPPAVSG